MMSASRAAVAVSTTRSPAFSAFGREALSGQERP